jgi:hypothetical protein
VSAVHGVNRTPEAKWTENVFCPLLVRPTNRNALGATLYY